MFFPPPILRRLVVLCAAWTICGVLLGLAGGIVGLGLAAHWGHYPIHHTTAAKECP